MSTHRHFLERIISHKFAIVINSQDVVLLKITNKTHFHYLFTGTLPIMTTIIQRIQVKPLSSQKALGQNSLP